MNHEMETLSKEVVVVYSEYYRGLFLRKSENTTINLSQASRCAGWDSNRVLPV
jgi:hypothetical protein